MGGPAYAGPLVVSARDSPGGRMDFGFTPEQARLRAELRAFLAGPEVQGILAGLQHLPPRASRHAPELHRMLAERGWLAIHWPAEYGGGGRSEIEAGIFVE